jgi:hypothetical protein
VLEVVDGALYSVTEARKKATKDANAKFKKAVDALTAYEKKYHSRETVALTMAEARAKDQSSLTILQKLKETLRVIKHLDLCFAAYSYWFLAVEGGTDEDSQVSSPQVPS